MDLFPRKSRNTGQQGWVRVLARMHLCISIKGSHLSFYAYAEFCPVKKSLFWVIFFAVESWTAPKDDCVCDSWEEFGIVVYPY